MPHGQLRPIHRPCLPVAAHQRSKSAPTLISTSAVWAEIPRSTSPLRSQQDPRVILFKHHFGGDKTVLSKMGLLVIIYIPLYFYTSTSAVLQVKRISRVSPVILPRSIPSSSLLKRSSPPVSSSLKTSRPNQKKQRGIITTKPKKKEKIPNALKTLSNHIPLPSHQIPLPTPTSLPSPTRLPFLSKSSLLASSSTLNSIFLSIPPPTASLSP